MLDNDLIWYKAHTHIHGFVFFSFWVKCALLVLLPDESMQKLFEGGKGSVFQRVLLWIPSNNHQLQLAGALAIANFARNGENHRG